MPVEPLDATVIICAYSLERWAELEEAIRRVQGQARPPRQTIVVIDDNEELLVKAREAFPEVTVVPNAHGAGASGGRNTGYELSSTPTLVFLDDDALPEPGWLERLLEPLEDASVLGTGGYLEPLWRSGRPAWFPHEFDWVVGCSYPGLPVGREPMRNPISANMSVRKAAFERAGGFENALSRLDVGGVVTGTAEETEFSIRAQQRTAGGRWMHAPDARALHVVPPGRTTFSYFRTRCRLEGTSKATLTRLTGRQTGLASERRYVTRILPGAFLRSLLRGLTGDGAALRRAAVIVVGLAEVSLAYARAELAFRTGRKPVPQPSVAAAE